MVALLCEGDARRELEATQAAVDALRSRIMLWDGIALAIENSEKSTLLAAATNASTFTAC
jgi:hypothetical protein